MLKIRWLCLLLMGLLSAAEPETLYVTWVDDPTSTMCVVWFGEAGEVQYRCEKSEKWLKQVGEKQDQYYIAHIKELAPQATYQFKLDEKVYKFRTAPKTLTCGFRFVVGGDIFYLTNNDVFREMNRTIAKDDPDMVVLGGDIAYTVHSKAGKTAGWALDRWKQFFKEIQTTMVRKDGRMIPLIPVVGNHDVHKHKQDELFYQVFPFPEKGRAYRNMVFGDYLDLVLLDTDHTWKIEGDQTEWLQSTLKAISRPYMFAVYHVAAYPSFYSFDSATPKQIRQLWLPLFEDAKLSGVFEHHNHTWSKTYPMKAGIIYFGDGSWGVPPREVHSASYLEEAESVNACWFVHLTKKEAVIKARTETGKVKTTVRLGPR